MRDIIKHYDLQAKKSLGQNFLFDLNLTAKIVRYAGDISKGTVFEIGPGPGALTRAIVASNAKEIIAIDPDTRCLHALEDYLLPSAGGRLQLIEGDALKLNLHEMGEKPRKIIANLPYNVGTPLLFSWLEHIEKFAGFTLMFQKEVVDRIIAKPKNKLYGRLSVMTQSICYTEKCFDIPPTAFFPPPKVTSSVVSIIPRKEPLLQSSYKALEQVTKAAFGQRRKVLRSSLKSLFKQPVETLQQLGINDGARAEELTIEQFCILAKQLESENKSE